ncbi:hypothetical protein PPROV_000184600 [Pycnococcus provasolii]|uniref:Uncharacterized protein n=1 Tax=Pycnococcus provasolii TaxID=41880 RepID=A0A830HBX7_9CHLO|nr:hypothetical protein PPROV_000184600 [Pycnococcus provasolii]
MALTTRVMRMQSQSQSQSQGVRCRTCTTMSSSTQRSRHLKKKNELNSSLALLASLVITVTPAAAHAVSIFEGNYADPKHPGCARAIASNGVVSGTDGTPGCENGEPQRPWNLSGKIFEDEKKIFIDFSPKGGPKDLTGEWVGNGVRFPDGNVWKKL